MDFSVSAFLEVIPRILPAALTNLQIAVFVIALSVVAGTTLTIVRSFKIRVVNLVIAVVISMVRGTPVLVQIFLFYYGVPALGIQLSPFTAGVCAIAFNSTMFTSETLRSGLANLATGPIEAAVALGLRDAVIWWKVVLPQLFGRVIPVLVNEATIVVKTTALLSVITVVEMLRTAQQISSTTFRPLEAILAAALIFLCINITISQIGRLVERRIAHRLG